MYRMNIYVYIFLYKIVFVKAKFLFFFIIPTQWERLIFFKASIPIEMGDLKHEILILILEYPIDV